MDARRLVFKNITVGGAFVLSFLLLSGGCRTVSPSNTLPLEQEELRQSRVNAIIAEATAVNIDTNLTDNERESRWEALMRKAVSEDPDRSASILLLGDFFARKKKTADAWELYRDFLSRHPGETAVLTAAADFAFNNRDAEKFGYCVQQLKETPDPDQQLVRSMSIAAFEQGLDADGFSLARSADRNGGDNLDFCKEIAEVGTGLLRNKFMPVLLRHEPFSNVVSNELKRARSLYDFAVELCGDPGGEPETVASMHRLSATCSVALGDARRVVDSNHRAFVLVDDDYLPLNEIAVALAAPGTEDVKKYFETLTSGPECRIEREMVFSYLDFVSEHPQRGAERALQLYRRLVEEGEIPPVQFFFTVSDMLGQAGRGMDSIEILREAVIRHPEDNIAKNNLAYSLAEHNLELDLAARLAVMALEEEPSSPIVLDTMAWVRFKQNRVYEALQLLLKAVSVDNGNNNRDPELLGHLRDLLLTTGNVPEARMVEKELQLLLKRNVETD